MLRASNIPAVAVTISPAKLAGSDHLSFFTSSSKLIITKPSFTRRFRSVSTISGHPRPRLPRVSASSSSLSSEAAGDDERREILVQHLLLKEDDAKLLPELLHRLSSGDEDLSDLAVEYSICPSKQDGGMLGWITKGQMVPEFEEAAFSAPLNKLVRCKSQFGWHLLQVLSDRAETPMKKKILVTGATGYLGGRLCATLLSQGHSVRALARRTSDHSSLPRHGGLELVYGDVTDYTSLLNAVSDCHVIFHAAALVELWLADPSRLFAVNVEGLENVLRAVKETNTVERIIYTSSFFALGPTDGQVADESQVHQEKFFCTEYERSKVITDKIALRAASEGLPIVLVYPGMIYGPGKLTSGNALAKILIERFNWGLPGYIGNGGDMCSYCHVDDVVEGHIAAMNKGRVGERYLLTGENASFNHVFDIAAIITGTSKPKFNIPLRMIGLYGWVSVFICRFTGKVPLISPPAVDVLRHQWEYSYEKAERELGYSPRSLREGLEEMLSWLKSLDIINY